MRDVYRGHSGRTSQSMADDRAACNHVFGNPGASVAYMWYVHVVHNGLGPYPQPQCHLRGVRVMLVHRPNARLRGRQTRACHYALCKRERRSDGRSDR